MNLLVAFTIPLRTVSALNKREHWGARAARVRRERRATGLAALAVGFNKTVGKRLVEQGPLVVCLQRVARRSMDDDNLRGALKAVRDALAQILGIDDADPRVSWAYSQRQGNKQEYAVEVTVEARE